MHKAHNILLAVCAGVVILAFFLPWVSVEAPAVGMISKILVGKQQAGIATISAFNVPVMANGPDARLMISIIRIFSPNVKDADKKSWLVWVIPGLAALLFLLSYLLDKNRWFHLGCGIIGCLIFTVAVYKLKTISMDKLVLNVTTGPGLWLTLWAYLVIGVAGIGRFLTGGAQR